MQNDDNNKNNNGNINCDQIISRNVPRSNKKMDQIVQK